MVLSSAKYPPHRRVEREARDLLRDGHQVFLMARRGPGQAAEETVGGVHVLRVPLPFQRRRLFADGFYYLLQRYYLIFYILRACRRHRIDALHVHDLPCAFATAVAARLLHLPFVFDMHEHYTAMLRMAFESDRYRRFKPLAFLLLTVLRGEERIACRWARKVIVVVDEHIDRIAALGVARADIVVVTNTEDIDEFRGLPLDEALLAQYRDEFVILYMGMFDPERGLETALRAMPAVLEQIPHARLLLVGDGPSRTELERLCHDLRLTAHVTFAGFRPFETTPTYIAASAVFLIPHISTPLVEMTIPNKLFQPMILGRPVVVSSTRPMTRIVQETRCGLVFQERDPVSLAETIVQLRDPELRRRLSENGQRAVTERYNWPTTVRALLELYRG
jgi:glycosyltransferase involved in cell wall biosynthesis